MKEQSKKKVGLFGLSGNPTHKGHIAAARAAREALSLDEVWFLINPHNPLKDPSLYAGVEHRMEIARLEVSDSSDVGHWLKISDFEIQLRNRDVENETIVMLQHFQEAYPHIQPVWLMGADNLTTIHTWGGHWNRIMEEYPVGVFSREGSNDDARGSVTARTYRDQEIDPKDFQSIPGYWSFIDSVKHPASSTEIRDQLWSEIKPDHISHQSREYMLNHGLYRPK